VFLAPSQDYALTICDGVLGTLPLADGEVGEWSTVAGDIPFPDRVAFSPSGKAAALYSVSRQRVQILEGLPNAVRVLNEFDTAGLPARVTALAVSDDAKLLLTGVSDGESGGVYALSRDGSPALVARAGNPSAIRVLADTRTAAFADGAWNQIVLLEDSSVGRGYRIIASATHGVSHPSDLGFSNDGRRIVVANSGSNTFLSIDLKETNPAAVSCAFTPLRVIRLATTIALTSADQASLCMLETGTSKVLQVGR